MTAKGKKKSTRKKAVALAYEEEKDLAPRVTAKGMGEIARKIIEIAVENDIPLYEDNDLASILMGVDLGREIPTELYRAIAEVLAFIYRMDRKYAKEISRN